MSKLKDLPKIDRSREKLVKKGADNLKDEELLAILLNAGEKLKNGPELIKKLLKKYSKKEGLDLAHKEIVKNIISEVESIESSTIQDDAFCYSNDQDVAKNMPKIIESVDKAKAVFKIAVIIGSGPLWNIPKEFDNIDLVLWLDINSNQLELNRQRILEIMSAQSPDDLLPKLNTSIDANDFIALKKEWDRMNAPKIEQDSYSSYHYLSSIEKLHETQDFLKKNKIAYVGGDISNRDFTKKLGDVLKKYKANVVFMDLTNVLEWIAGSPGHVDQEVKENYLKSLGNLPLTENCAILHSHSIGRVGRSPIVSRLDFGLDSYN